MRIALVCGHFLPSMGYVEVYLAKCFQRMGHEVNVFTTAHVPAYIRHLIKEEFSTGVSTEPTHGYTITRLNTRVAVGQMVTSPGLRKEVDGWQPELCIVIGLGKLFPKKLFDGKRSYPIVTLLGDNADNHEASKAKPGLDTVKRKLKQQVYARAGQYSDIFFPYTPETMPLVKEMVPSRLHDRLDERTKDISLGFDPDKFSYDESLRTPTRAEYGLPAEAPVLMTATRIIPHKRLENIIDVVDRLNAEGQELHYVIIGFADDDYGQEVKDYIVGKDHADQFHCLPFQPHDKVKALYHAADLAWFPTNVISIFEALGTGLPVILPTRPGVSHIVQNGKNGWYAELDDLYPTYQQALKALTSGSMASRSSLAKSMEEQFSWPSIARQILIGGGADGN